MARWIWRSCTRAGRIHLRPDDLAQRQQCCGSMTQPQHARGRNPLGAGTAKHERHLLPGPGHAVSLRHLAR